MTYQYRSIKDLNQCIIENLHKNPPDVDLVVGMPRSGLLAANMLALHLNCALTDVERFLENKQLETGFRLRGKTKTFNECKNVLVLEDSVYSGRSIKEIKLRIGDRYPDKNITYGAVFISPGTESLVDIYYEVCPIPRVFEWNLMHHKVLSNSCVAVEGVLLKGIQSKDSQEIDSYSRLLKTAQTCFKPTVPVCYLVSQQPEKHRPQMEAWLKAQNIDYEKLVMTGLIDGKTQKSPNKQATRKTLVYQESGCTLFVESDHFQAKKIANASGKSVICTETKEIMSPTLIGESKSAIRQFTNARILEGYRARLARRLRRMLQNFIA